MCCCADTNERLEGLTIGQQEQLRQLAESSQKALAEAITKLDEQTTVTVQSSVSKFEILLAEKATTVDLVALEESQRDALSTAVARCVSASTLEESLQEQAQTTNELGKSVRMAMQKTVAVCGDRVAQCDSDISNCNVQLKEIKKRIDQAEAWMENSDTERMHSAAELEEARLLAEQETAQQEMAAMPFTIIVSKALIRQKVNAKPYVVYQFDVSYRGQIHRFFERYSAIYDFYMVLRKELKIPKTISFPVKYAKTLDPEKLERRRTELDRFFNLLFNWGLRNGVPLLRMSTIQRWLLKIGDLPPPEMDEAQPKLTSLEDESVVPLAPAAAVAAVAAAALGGPFRDSQSQPSDSGVAADDDFDKLRQTTAYKRDMLKKLANESAVMDAAGGK
eukprot:SAG31_NODE_298_length_18125_cov_27.373350_10_plen_392_part_00